MGRPRPVREVMALLGSSPLIAMPLDASNAGKNYGTGGDFTANSAPYVGARGASEFWARSASFSAMSGDLRKETNIYGQNSRNISIVFCMKADSITGGKYILALKTALEYMPLYISRGNNFIGITCSINSSTILDILVSNVITTNFDVFMLSLDSLIIGNNKCVVNGVNKTVSVNSFTSSAGFDLSSTSSTYIGSTGNYASFGVDGLLSSFYFTTDYIDFSQEANRLKFVDGLGYPLDLAKQIDAGIIPKPLIYLPFDDTTNLGKNLGTGGDFAVNGSVTAGADFSL